MSGAFRVIVKGPQAAAIATIEARGLHHISSREFEPHGRGGNIKETHAIVTGEVRHMSRWFCERGEIIAGYGYADGSCIHYQHIEP